MGDRGGLTTCRRVGALAGLALALALLGPRAAPAEDRGARAADAGPVLTIVRVATPWWAPDFLVDRRFEASVPRYRAVPGLWRKFYLRTGERALGGVYLWRSRADAERFYDAAWHADIAARYGEPARLDWFRVEATGPPSTGAVRTDLDTVALIVPSTPGRTPSEHDAIVLRETLSSDLGTFELVVFPDDRAAERFRARHPIRSPATDLDDWLFRLPVAIDNR